MDDLRRACAQVAAEARHVHVVAEAIPAYAATLTLPERAPAPAPLTGAAREHAAASVLTLDAINFGSGWFPTLRKRPGLSGYGTVAAGLAEHEARHGPFTAAALTRLGPEDLGRLTGQDAEHPLMTLFAASLNDLGARVASDHGGGFARLVDGAGGSAVSFARALGRWPCFADCSRLNGHVLPFLKRAQIAAADLARARVVSWADLDRLTMFADNLVPHVLRLDGVLRFAPALVARIEREELITHGSREEVEIRACALHAVEAITAARPGSCAAEVDQRLWERGGGAAYKARPRHRSRCTAY
ncbi:MAG TPA: queuosine salvage family protein [Solirubrobacteraceae bacterium]|nr:queuosine salvage family protein [Solirubrobacteraceae bacterium]